MPQWDNRRAFTLAAAALAAGLIGGTLISTQLRQDADGDAAQERNTVYFQGYREGEAAAEERYADDYKDGHKAGYDKGYDEGREKGAEEFADLLKSHICPAGSRQVFWVKAVSECTPVAVGGTAPATTPTLPALPSIGGGTVCSDGWISGSTGQGTCSHHGGIVR